MDHAIATDETFGNELGWLAQCMEANPNREESR
jgi:hypothetical protein